MDSHNTPKRTLKPPIKISILEKQESEVSYCWKAWMIFSYSIVVISGIATCLAIGSVSKMFGNECILYSKPENVQLQNKTIIIYGDGSTSEYWGKMYYCNFCQFMPVGSVIFGGVWLVLFFMCGHGGNSDSNLPQAWRIVMPAIFFSFVFVVLSCVGVAFTFGGFSSFCEHVLKNIEVPNCEALDEYTWKDYPDAKLFYDDVIIAEVGSAITLVGWLIGFLILTIRCITHADFRVVARPVEPTPKRKNGTTTAETTVDNSTAVSPKSSPTEEEPLILVTPVKPT